MAGQIPEPAGGQATNKLWSIVKACVQALNAFRDAKVLPTGDGKFIWGDGNVVLDLTALSKKAGSGGSITVDTIFAEGGYDTTLLNITKISFWNNFFTIVPGNAPGEVIVKSDIPDPPASGNFALLSVGGYFQWVPICT
jgi:hypothetical protein